MSDSNEYNSYVSKIEGRGGSPPQILGLTNKENEPVIAILRRVNGNRPINRALKKLDLG